MQQTINGSTDLLFKSMASNDKTVDGGLDGYDSELVRCIRVIRSKREEINNQIIKVRCPFDNWCTILLSRRFYTLPQFQEEEDRIKVQRELKILQERLHQLNGRMIAQG